MTRLLSIACLCLAVTISVSAQATQQKTETKPPDAKPSEPMPTVDQILDKYVQALGGKSAVEKITSRTAKGTFDIPAMGASGPIEVFAKAPSMSAFVLEIPGFGTVKQGFDGISGWSQDPASGTRDMSAAEVSAAKRDDNFHRDIKLKELYSKMEVKGKGKVGDRDAYVIEATPSDGTADKFYFDTQSGLLVRSDIERETPQGKLPAEVYTEDYREVDGIKVPFTIRQSNPVFSFTVKLTEVKHNVPIDDAKFKKPAAQ